MQPIKPHTEVVQYGSKDDRVAVSPLDKDSRNETKSQTADIADDDRSGCYSEQDRQ